MDVEVSLRFLNFGPLDQKKSQYSVLLHVYVTWFDPRLAIDYENSSRISQLEIGEELLSRIWKPPLHFANAHPFTADILSPRLPGQMSGIITGDGRVFIIKK